MCHILDIKQGFSGDIDINVSFHNILLMLALFPSKHWDCYSASPTSLEMLTTQILSANMVSMYVFSCAALVYCDCSWGWCHGTIVSYQAQFEGPGRSYTRKLLRGWPQLALTRTASSKWSEVTSYFPKGPWQLLCFKRMCPVWLAVSHIPPDSPGYRVTEHTLLPEKGLVFPDH